MPIQQISDTRESVVAAIRKVAGTQNADFKYLLNQANVESGLDPRAKASTSSAAGLFQFTSGTWINMVKLHGDQVGLASQAQSLRSNATSNAERAQILGLRNDPELATALAAHLAADNAQALSDAGHKSIGPTELYLAHFLGSAGANTFLNGLRETPSQPAASALPAAASANPGVFYSNNTSLSYQDIYNRFARKFADAAAITNVAVPTTTNGSIPTKDSIGGFETKLKQIITTALAATRQQTSPSTAAATASAPPVTEGAMHQFLKNFSLVDQSGGMAQIGLRHAKSASSAASTTSAQGPISEQSVSPLVSGARMILTAADSRPQDEPAK